jgi:hypothetical protein
MFRNQIAVPIDIFAINFAYLYQVSVGSIDFFVRKLTDHIKSLAHDLHYSIDLRKDANTFKKLVNAAVMQDLSADVGDEPDDLRPTRKRIAGKSAQVMTKGFDINLLRAKAHAIK